MSATTLRGPVTRLTWRTTDKMDLISVENSAIHVHLYDATPDDLRSLVEAIAAVLQHLETLNSLHYPDPAIK